MNSSGTEPEIRPCAHEGQCYGCETSVLEAMFANIHVLIAVMDRNMTLLRVNTAFCESDGRPADVLLGRYHFELYPDEENERIFYEVLETGRPYSVIAKPFVYAHRPELGVTYWDWTVAPLHGPLRTIDGVILTLVDVTEQENRRREAERMRELLEQRVRERTAALENAVEELESFSYCVSHDLSAPLRAINGYASVIAEEFSPSLPEEVSNYLARIREASTRMDQLMMGLLQLNRVSRADLQRQDVDLSRMAHQVVDDLAREQPRREVEFICDPALRAQMDPDMARILLANLLGNAWKFTGRNPRARIEFGAYPCCEESFFFVRDNGVGFDMAFVDKLYGTFQRLHRSDDFPGSGIGLATVARIVRSHGGRIWAEAKEGEGASFFFTLGSPARCPAR